MVGLWQTVSRSCQPRNCMALCRQLLGGEPHGLADLGDENWSLTEENMKFPKMINKLQKIPSNSQMCSSTVVLVCPFRNLDKKCFTDLYSMLQLQTKQTLQQKQPVLNMYPLVN